MSHSDSASVAFFSRVIKSITIISIYCVLIEPPLKCSKDLVIKQGVEFSKMNPQHVLVIR